MLAVAASCLSSDGRMTRIGRRTATSRPRCLAVSDPDGSRVQEARRDCGMQDVMVVEVVAVCVTGGDGHERR